MQRSRFGLIVVLSACIGGEPTAAPSPPTGDPSILESEARVTLSLTDAAWGPWSAPINVTAVNSPFLDRQPSLSPDQLSLYFVSARPGGLGGNDMWVSRRASLESPWQPPIHLGAALNSPGNDAGQVFSQDGRLIFFHSSRVGGQGAVDIWMSRRDRLDDDFNWGPLVNLGPDVNTSAFEAGPMYMPQIDEGRVNLYFSRGADLVAHDMYSVAIDRNGRTLGPAVPISELNVPLPGITDGRPTIARDGKELYFYSNRAGGLGEEDLYVSTRQSMHSPWSAPVNAGTVLNSAARDSEPALSPDGGTLFFASERPGGVGGRDIWMSTRTRGAKQ